MNNQGRTNYQNSQYQGYDGNQKPSQYNPDAYHTSQYQGNNRGQTTQVQNPNVGGSQPHNYHTSRYQGYAPGNAPQPGTSLNPQNRSNYGQAGTSSSFQTMYQTVPTGGYGSGYFGSYNYGNSYNMNSGWQQIQSQLSRCRQNIEQINQLANQLSQAEQQNRQELEQLYQIEEDNYRRLEHLTQMESQASQHLQQIQSMCNQVNQEFRTIENQVVNQTNSQSNMNSPRTVY